MKNKDVTKRKSAAYQKIRRRKIVTGVIVVILLAIICLFTPVFSVSEVSVSGTEVLDPDAVIKASGIKAGDNFLFVNTAKSEKAINALGYVDKVEVKRKFFTRIEIEVTEAIVAAYITFSGNYVGIDAEGKVISIDKAGKFKPARAVLTGLEAKNVKKGQMLEPKNQEKFEFAKEFMALLKREKLLDDTIQIDIKNESNVSFTLKNKVEILLGDASELEYKLEYVKVILEKQPNAKGGTLDISNTSNVIYRPREGSKKK